MGAGLRRGPSRLGYPGSLGGLPASLLSMPVLSILCIYTLPTTIVCSSATLPFPLPLSTWLACAVLFFFPAVCVVFLLFVWSYTGCPLFSSLFTVTRRKFRPHRIRSLCGWLWRRGALLHLSLFTLRRDRRPLPLVVLILSALLSVRRSDAACFCAQHRSCLLHCPLHDYTHSSHDSLCCCARPFCWLLLHRCSLRVHAVRARTSRFVLSRLPFLPSVRFHSPPLASMRRLLSNETRGRLKADDAFGWRA